MYLILCNTAIFVFPNLAPGSYDTEKSMKTILDSSTAYSFGIKYKEPKLDDTPGNEAYLFKKNNTRNPLIIS